MNGVMPPVAQTLTNSYTCQGCGQIFSTRGFFPIEYLKNLWCPACWTFRNGPTGPIQ